MSDVGQHLLSGIAHAIRREDSPVTFFPGASSGFASSFLLQPCTSAPLSSRPILLLLTTLLVDLIKTRIQQGDAQLAKTSALFALLRPNLTSLFNPGKLAPFAPPRDRSFLPRGYTVSGAARPQR